MPTFFLDAKDFSKSEIILTGENAHHLTRVLRAKMGEKIKVAFGATRLFEAKVKKIEKDSVSITLEDELSTPPSPFPIHLFISLIEKEKIEWVIEKAVELNIEAVHFIISKRSIKKEYSEAYWQRLHRIRTAAQKQCGRLVSLQIAVPVEFKTAFLRNPFGSHFFCVPDEKKSSGTHFKTQFEGLGARGGAPPHALWIGPEGGWEEEEIEFARQRRAQCVLLGPLILRTETAAIYGVSVLLAHLNFNHS